MTAIRISLDGDRVGALFRRATERYGAKVRDAVRGAAKDAAEEIEEKGREDIASAGNFGSRWTEGLKATVTEGGGNIRINVTEDVSYWAVFEYGAIIQGNPLLWIPFSDSDAVGISAKDYPSPLFEVTNREGLPLLFSWTPGVKNSASDQPLYFAKDQVVEPQKFHLRDIIRQVANELPQMYKRNFG